MHMCMCAAEPSSTRQDQCLERLLSAHGTYLCARTFTYTPEPSGTRILHRSTVEYPDALGRATSRGSFLLNFMQCAAGASKSRAFVPRTALIFARVHLTAHARCLCCRRPPNNSPHRAQQLSFVRPESQVRSAREGQPVFVAGKAALCRKLRRFACSDDARFSAVTQIQVSRAEHTEQSTSFIRP